MASSPPPAIFLPSSPSSTVLSPYVGVSSTQRMPSPLPSPRSATASEAQKRSSPSAAVEAPGLPNGAGGMTNNAGEPAGENYLLHQQQQQQQQQLVGALTGGVGVKDVVVSDDEGDYLHFSPNTENGDGAEDAVGAGITSVSSQEEMISLLPEKNASYGFRAREASLSCRFRRRGTGDKFKTIGIGGSRVSHHDLAGHAHLDLGISGQRRPSEEEFAAMAAQHQAEHQQLRRSLDEGAGAALGGLQLQLEAAPSPRSLNGHGGFGGGNGKPPRHEQRMEPLSPKASSSNGPPAANGGADGDGGRNGERRPRSSPEKQHEGKAVEGQARQQPQLSPPQQQQQVTAAHKGEENGKERQQRRALQQLPQLPQQAPRKVKEKQPKKPQPAASMGAEGHEEEEESLPAWASHAVGALVHGLLARVEALGDKLVKAVDDAILGATAPLVALYLSLEHGLPRALNRVAFEKDLRMPLPRRKGEKHRHSLSFMLLHPVDSGRRRRYPTILVRNPYGRLTFFYTFYLFAQRGFNVVVQDVRGRGESTGVFDCIHDEEDGRATLEWITSQPWYSAEHGIGCLGMSYNGYCLFSTFKDPSVPIPPAVRAVVPINTTSRLSTMSYRDGPLHLELIIRWSGYLWALTRDTTSLLKLGLSLLHGCTFLGYGFFDHPRFTRAVRHLPVHEITKEITGIALTRGGMFYYPPECDFCQARCASGALREDLPPAQIHASWYDIFLIDSFFDYNTLVAKGNTEARIMISSDFHIKRYFQYGALVKEAIAHFRRFCRREPQPYKDDERVTVQVIHPAKGLEWVGLPSWPPAQTQTLPALLSADGTLHLCTEPAAAASSSATTAVTPGPRAYTYYPADPTPSVGGNGIGFIDAGAKDQRRLEAREKTVGDLLVYTSAPLTEDVYVIGTPTATLWLRCLSPRASQADFVVRLCDVDARGKSINVCDGVKRVRDFKALEWDAERGAFKVEVEVYPTAARFAKGHRLRVHVASAGFIRWERNVLAYGYPSFLPVSFELLHGDGVESAVALPVVPAASLMPSRVKM